jgi:hypothetical protein
MNSVNLDKPFGFKSVTFFAIIIFLFFGLKPVLAQDTSPQLTTQSELYLRALTLKPSGDEWVKPEPGLGYRIPKDPSAIPDFIKDNVGTIDDINRWQPEDDKYANLEDFFKKNAGRIVSLQYANGKPDFYVIGRKVWDEKYQEIPSDEAINGNKKLVSNLSKVSGMEEFLDVRPIDLVGTRKFAPVMLVRMSQLGYSTQREITLPKPEWGANQSQTKPANKDAFIVFEASNGKAYMVNTEPTIMPDGTIVDRPIAYVPKDEAKLIQQGQFVTTQIQIDFHANGQDASYEGGHVKDGMTSELYEVDVTQVILTESAKAAKKQGTTPEALIGLMSCDEILNADQQFRVK